MPVTSWPRMETSPWSGVSRPAMTRSRVDLPLPLGPSSAVRDPPPIPSETSSRATKSPKRFVTCRIAIDIGYLPSATRVEQLHGDQRDHGEEREHEGRGVRGHLVEAQVLLVDVDGQGLRLAGEAPRHDCDGAVLAERTGRCEHDSVGNAPANRRQ